VTCSNGLGPALFSMGRYPQRDSRCARHERSPSQDRRRPWRPSQCADATVGPPHGQRRDVLAGCTAVVERVWTGSSSRPAWCRVRSHGITAPVRRPRAVERTVLRGLASTLDLDHLVVHGWSLGGLVALLFADLQPERVDRLVLTAPTLPGPMTTGERAGWQTLGRLALLVGPALVDVLVGVFGSSFVDAKRRGFDPRALSARGYSPELTTLFTEQLDELRAQPQRLRDFVTPFASAVSAMYVDRRPVLDVIDRVSAPTILLWGDQDPLVEHAVLDYLIARRPDWDLHISNSVGHLPPWEAPHAYTQAVGQWLAGPTSPSEGAADETANP
jgi:pimeloyl-ACP methyl ester carboxylesterase